MADTIKVKASMTKTIFLPGYGQLVLDPKSKDKAKSAPEVPAKFLDRLVAENAIVKPKGYKSPAERQAEIDEAQRAIGIEPEVVKIVELTEFALGGFTLTDNGGGWFVISDASGEFAKVQGEEDAKTKLIELLVEAATAPTEPAPSSDAAPV